VARTIRILVVDDHSVVRAGVVGYLARQNGFKVVAEAESCATAVEAAHEHEPDIAVVDVQLPDGSGIDLCIDIPASSPKTGVVLFTSFAEPELLERALSAGARGYVLKRMDLSALAEAVRVAAEVFSGIQPTGDLHIGSLTGALRNWVSMQDEYDTIYCVVDLHAMTVPYDVAEFHRSRLDTAKMLLAVGIDPDRSLLYYQSQVPHHAELSWILGTMTGLGQLERMTQFKEKADRAGQNLGLLSYPVLMAADILVHHVPRRPGRRRPDPAPGADPGSGRAFQLPLRGDLPRPGADHARDRRPGDVAAGPDVEDVQVRSQRVVAGPARRRAGHHRQEGEVGRHRLRDRRSPTTGRKSPASPTCWSCSRSSPAARSTTWSTSTPTAATASSSRRWPTPSSRA
jgi:CheY-like chemotaxis protein